MRLLILTFSFLISLLTVGQKSYKPTIVVLDPYQTKYDSTLLTEIEKFSYEAYISSDKEKEILDSLMDNEKNIQIMDVAEFEFGRKMNFGSSFTFSLNTMLTYMVFGQTDKCIVFPSHDISNGEIISLKSIAKKHNVLWVVNPLTLHTYIKEGNKFMTVRIQVFNAKKNKIVLDKEYTGGTTNPGFELSCERGTLGCTVNNVINPSLHDILLTILKTYQH